MSGPGRALQKEAPDAKEFAGLRRSALARLTDSAKNSNSLESRFDLAYNAAHALCLAALRWHGYRPTNRYIVFQTLPHTLGLGPEVWRLLDKCHSVRNLGEYEGDLNVDERLVADLVVAAGLWQQNWIYLRPFRPRFAPENVPASHRVFPLGCRAGTASKRSEGKFAR